MQPNVHDRPTEKGIAAPTTIIPTDAQPFSDGDGMYQLGHNDPRTFIIAALDQVGESPEDYDVDQMVTEVKHVWASHPTEDSDGELNWRSSQQSHPDYPLPFTIWRV